MSGSLEAEEEGEGCTGVGVQAWQVVTQLQGRGLGCRVHR